MTDADKNAPPTPWWEWVLFPVTAPLLMIALLVVGVISIPGSIIVYRLQQFEERKLRDRLAAVDRYLRWTDLEAQLELGAGTLIFDCHLPKGPARCWWTEEDLLAAAPMPLPTSSDIPPPDDPLHLLEDYTTYCRNNHVDVDTGTALLCELTISERELEARYPETRIVTLLTSFGETTRLYQGDYEMVVWGHRH